MTIPDTARTPDPTIHLRDATASDAEAMSALLKDLGHSTSASEIPARLAAVLRDHGAVLLAVDDADEPLDMISLTRH